MQRLVEKLRTQHNRKSTNANYLSVWQSFNDFFIRLDEKPDTWEDRLTLYVAFLVDQQKKASTIKSYISAVKSVLLDDRIVLNQNKYFLTALTHACKFKNNSVHTRLPIQNGILKILIKTMRTKMFDGQPYLRRLHVALISTAYFGLFRVGVIDYRGSSSQSL